jgi:hypothetical protein
MRKIALLFLVLAGCDECVDGETICDGRGIVGCGRRGFTELSPCACVFDGCRNTTDPDGLRHAVCSPSPQPDPRCEGAAPYDNICVGNTRLTCDNGYAGFEHQCAILCVSPEPGVAFCALSDQTELRCAGGDGARCSGTTIVRCLRGLPIAEEPCVAPFAACVLVPDNLGGQHPACATADSDPGCEVDSPGRCDGLDIFGCRNGRRTFEHCEYSCYENPIDSMFPEAFCEGPSCRGD